MSLIVYIYIYIHTHTHTHTTGAQRRPSQRETLCNRQQHTKVSICVPVVFLTCSQRNRPLTHTHCCAYIGTYIGTYRSYRDRPLTHTHCFAQIPLRARSSMAPCLRSLVTFPGTCHGTCVCHVTRHGPRLGFPRSTFPGTTPPPINVFSLTCHVTRHGPRHRFPRSTFPR